MVDFGDTFLSEDYLRMYCLFQECRALVFVEGLRDIAFWDGMLNNEIEGIKYKIINATENGTKGKTVLKKYMHHANKFSIFAMDSDFDYLCPNQSEHSIFLNECVFVLQTFVYSKESVSYHHSVIDDCISKLQVSSKVNFSIKENILGYSKAVYEILTAYLYLKDKNYKLDDAIFHRVITPDEIILDQNYIQQNDMLSNMKARINDYLAEISQSIIDHSELIKFKQQLLEKGLNEETAYQFINGHHLEDKVVMPIIFIIIRTLKNKEMELIKQQCLNNPSLIHERKKELMGFIDCELNFKSLMHNCKSMHSTPCMVKIRNQLSLH